jgi:TonB family protein
VRRSVHLALPLAVCLAGGPLAAQDASAAADTVYEVTAVEVRPEALNVEELGEALYARYPPRLRAAGVNGTATVSLVVGSDGVPRDVRLVASSDSAFDAPTLEAVALLRFSPAQMDGRAVAVRLELPVGWETRTVAPQPDSTGAYELGQVHVQPRPTNVRALRAALARLYPAHLRSPAIQAVVYVRFRAAPDGTVTHAHITESSDARFNEATIAAAQVLRYTPARIDGRPVAVWLELPIRWSMGR